MEGVPVLSAQDLRADLEEAYRSRRHHHLFAFYGSGREDVLDVADTKVRVVPVRSELELREKLPKLEEDDDLRLAFLVPWTHDIPLDLAGRFALNGRVRKIGKESRLRAMFGVSEVDDEARRSPLAEYLLRPGGGGAYSLGSESRLTLDSMWAAWLRTDWGLDTRQGLALDTLLGFVALDARGPSFAEAMSRPEAGATHKDFLAWLERTLGPCGPVLWKAWESGRGRRAMELALVFEPLVKSPLAAVRMWVKTKARDSLSIEKDADVRVVAEALGREAGSAMRVLERRGVSATELRSLARSADELVVDAEVEECLVESHRLPSAWTRRLETLGAALKRGSTALTPETATEAARALRAMESHTFFKDEDQRPVLKRAEMAVRLLAWLVARPDQKLELSLTPHGDAEALGRWYALEGGYVDRARRWARGSELGAFGSGVQAVVTAADEARAQLDLRFAKGLAAWVESGQPATQVVPIHDAVKRIAVKFLDGNHARRLLVLLMDGMAWAQATEILESLGNRAAPWGPLAWHVQRDTRIGESPLPVVFAALPTVTEVSRSSFFGGKTLGPGAKLTTSDVDHWEAHTLVKRLVPPTDKPRLLLRGEGHTKAGGASQEALSLVSDPNRRIVALVLNAIDDSLKASHEVRHPWGVENIASLPDLLEKARESGRAVLLASDHGHVPADRLQRVTPSSEAQGARWRVWPSATAPLAANEVGFSGSRVYVPRGSHGIALLADDASCYVGSTHAGEHGGATLAEVVAPCALIGCEDTTAAADDAGQRPQAMLVPRWWHFDVAAEPVAAPVAETTPSKKPIKNENQLALPVIVPVEPKKSVPPPASAFSGSEVLKARAPVAVERAQVIAAVDLLLAKGAVMSAEAFGAGMRVLPFRVGGLISKLQEVLNLDGYEVIKYDPGSRQVHLDKGKLAQLFEVRL
ncbi:MAG: BREX-2 system phosphatase PglZ [Deltaproteobacteria bacterium]|nr:BREX-2 system phosphatase PglZ [Deltaproteobacteria bacterium]